MVGRGDLCQLVGYAEGRNAYERVFIANQLASFAPAAGWFFQTWKTEKRIAAWDARAALGTLERGMIE